MCDQTRRELKTAALYTLGCKLNFSETATLARDLKRAGYRCVDFSAAADLYVINTCSVTERADRRLKTLVKKALCQNPDAFVVAIGCYAQLKPAEIAALDGVDMVLGASEKFKLCDYLTDLTKRAFGEVHACEIEAADFYVSAYALGGRTRAFLKVQDGCDYKCSYCTIPLARGRSRSDTLENILQQAEAIGDRGVREIVLTGVNIGDYGKGAFGGEKRAYRFLDLIRALDEVPSVDRFRISSIEPELLQAEIIELIAESKRFVPHFHMPLQSGSNTILSKMRRRYRREHYAERVDQIKAVMPQACIGADVIVGFPTESEAHFLESYQFLNDLDIAYLHVFTYSERAGAAALQLKPVVPPDIRRRRSQMLRSLSAKKRRHFYKSQLNRIGEVLFEGENKGGYMRGFTENYVRIKHPWNPEWVNTIQSLRLSQIAADGLVTLSPLEAPIPTP